MPVDPFHFYRALRTVNPSPYMYFLRFQDAQVAGASPEMMVRVEGQTRADPAHCRHLSAGENSPGRRGAGPRSFWPTPRNGPSTSCWWTWAATTWAGYAGYGSVRVNELMAMEKYSHVMHIVSNVVGTLKKNKNAFDVIRACFPAGTLSGAPKVRAMEIIEELEPVRRGIYGGAIGYFSFSGDADTAITIRTLLAKNGIGYIQAGAGIVADSQPAKEYEETLNKAMALLKALDFAQREFGH